MIIFTAPTFDRDYVADVIADKITGISYPNFKGAACAMLALVMPTVSFGAPMLICKKSRHMELSRAVNCYERGIQSFCW